MEVAMAKALTICYPDIVDKIDLDNSEWTKSLFRRMGYTRVKGATAKLEMPTGLCKEAELLFDHQSLERVETKRNSKQLSIKRSHEKRSLTATFTITPDGTLLRMQLIYDGKTKQSLPRYEKESVKLRV